ncbi:MAG: efflux RND transporter periplasmic adaptor subunit [Phormidium sp. BM_Day4_Bin.17]|nr:efflux RND transporter periplasmic adaptor subunit [Phormidium sp. BM_Day4_Bin.17]UCJ11150.1 MAG: efflux RND transporter periplasmic adaptor subunit [Phormidium sp. PBR-2020]
MKPLSYDIDHNQRANPNSSVPPTPEESAPAIPDEEFPPESEPPAPRGINWKSILIGLGLGIVLAGIGGRLFSESSPETPAADTEETERNPSQTVTAITVGEQAVNRTLNASGSVNAYDLLPILPRATGLQILDVRVREGDIVGAGEVLAVLDDSVLQSQLSGALSQIDSARSSVSAAQADISQAESSRRQAEADLERARTGIRQAESRVAQAEASLTRNRARVTQAQASLEQSEREYQRYQQLANEGAISRQEVELRERDVRTAREDVNQAVEEVRVAEAELDSARADVLNAEANVQSAQATVESTLAGIEAAQAGVANAQSGVQNQDAVVQELETRLNQTLVVAPQGGIIAERQARVGDVSGNNPLFTLIAQGQLELQLQVPETQLPLIRPGAPVRVRSDADSRIDVRGRVREILPTINPETRQATVVVDLPSDDSLRPGMFLEGEIVTETLDSLTIPSAAVLPQADGSAQVFRLNPDDTVTATRIELGEVVDAQDESEESQVEVLSGLNAGDRIVVSGAGFLSDGDLVRVVD